MWMLIRAFPHHDEEAAAPEAVALQDRQLAEKLQALLPMRWMLNRSLPRYQLAVPLEPLWLGYEDVEELVADYRDRIWEERSGCLTLPSGVSLMGRGALSLNRSELVLEGGADSHVDHCLIRGWSESGRYCDSWRFDFDNLLSATLAGCCV